MENHKKRNVKNLINPILMRGILSLATKGYFEEKGWNLSYKRKESVDALGDPIPWLTYSFLDFLHGRLTNQMTLFEYGSGNSTLYFSKKVKKVDSVEDDLDWLNKINSLLPDNATIHHHSLDSADYERAILKNEEKYDIILIDGRKRVACIKNSIERVKSDGVIILDDAERSEYSEAYRFMNENGYKHIPFSGIAIGAIHHKITTVFYRQNNCLGI